ncbi:MULTISPECIES: hypothetical protein [Mycobacteriaceae]|uniref:Acetaldehyde dehydrogenase C-terminal domain-containing protein n=1 Tax=Mycolicibacterium mucogenicum DSM 44124 TaxID=1226753 RepID=A0A8H2PGF9_MYCMU|nr:MULTISPECIES: hypothetical protein [Mycobacteriaceae]KAB7753997.1 acetaldehyde dehydrogenase [Mycolicibacterium mucogenicum DSM 44124]QPG70775.1 hypothetical protein C1S78_007400 [Mycolicibacterium mucogenicum DSM 44124]SEB02875.1 acetaldehyde dehydrogenase (acetylating) [Mycobacterium sp. 283mftsu]
MTATAGATAPIVAAVARSSSVIYAEIVSSISARSAGPDIRGGIDDLIETTCAAVQTAGARHAKVISLLSPSPSTRNTIYCLVDGAADHVAIERDIHTAVARIGAEVGGFRLKQAVQFESIGPIHIPEIGAFAGTKVTVLVEVATENAGVPT